jgi:hypothetical protein
MDKIQEIVNKYLILDLTNIILEYYIPTKFTFFYCVIHDQGFVIENEEDTSSIFNGRSSLSNINTCGVNGCVHENNGTIEISTLNFTLINNLKRVNYEKYGGGWKFDYFKLEFFKENGNRICCPPYLEELFNID